MADKELLTEDRIRSITPPAKGEYVLWDKKLTGFHVRCFPSGRKVYSLVYRVAGSGRNGKKRRLTLKPIGDISLADARAAAQYYLGQVAAGRDPAAERKEAVRQKAARLDRALADYEAYLQRRKVVNAKQIIRTLKRYLPGPLERMELPALDRQKIAAQIAKIEAGKVVIRTEERKRSHDPNTGKVRLTVRQVKRMAGGAGAAADFRAKARTFFEWAVSQGLIYANPLSGWRRERATRSQVTNRKGRALSPEEIRTVWNACDSVPAPYGDYVRLLLLTGQRRTETAKMRWQDVDLKRREWVIPATVAKNGRRHVVPLPAEAVAILLRQQRHVSNPYVFSGRANGSAISGWTKRQAGLVRESGVSFTLHDLRRTFRSGLRRLGVDSELAEMMLNHTRAELIEIYDREPRMADRIRAAEKWANYLVNLCATPSPEIEKTVELATNVIPLSAMRVPA